MNKFANDVNNAVVAKLAMLTKRAEDPNSSEYTPRPELVIDALTAPGDDPMPRENELGLNPEAVARYFDKVRTMEKSRNSAMLAESDPGLQGINDMINGFGNPEFSSMRQGDAPADNSNPGIHAITDIINAFGDSSKSIPRRSRILNGMFPNRSFLGFPQADPNNVLDMPRAARYLDRLAY